MCCRQCGSMACFSPLPSKSQCIACGIDFICHTRCTALHCACCRMVRPEVVSSSLAPTYTYSTVVRNAEGLPQMRARAYFKGRPRPYFTGIDNPHWHHPYFEQTLFLYICLQTSRMTHNNQWTTNQPNNQPYDYDSRHNEGE